MKKFLLQYDNYIYGSFLGVLIFSAFVELHFKNDHAFIFAVIAICVLCAYIAMNNLCKKVLKEWKETIDILGDLIEKIKNKDEKEK